MMCTVVDGWWCYYLGVRMTVSGGGVGDWTWCNQWCYQTGEVGMNWQRPYYDQLSVHGSEITDDMGVSVS